MSTKTACRILLAGLCLAALPCWIGCSSPKPLVLRHYAANIVVKPDRTILVEGTPVRFEDLKHTLIIRGTTDNAPIAVHVHRSVPRQAFDNLVKRLASDGFTNVSFDIYDIEP